MRAVIDSDVLIDYLQGAAQARRELELYDRREISIISWMEIMAGADSPEEERICRAFLGSFEIHPLNPTIAEDAVALRRRYGLRLPDAVIWATARILGCLLITRNTRDFPKDDPGVRFPYTLPQSTSGRPSKK